MKSAQDFMLEIPVLNYNDGITKARQILRDDRFREIYVTGAKKTLAGYIDITDALRVTATKSNVTIEGFVKDAACVNPGDPIEHVAKMMQKFHMDSAAVIDHDRHILGGVLLSDLFPVIISRNELSGRVQDRMSRTVVTAGPAETIQKIYTKIIESGFSAFPVMKKGRLLGIISRRDLISSRSVRSALATHAHRAIGEIMTKEVITIAPGEEIREAAALMVRHDVSRLPVIDRDVLVGIVDRHDVLGGLA
jgi:CBS domain-containing protein